MKFRNIASTLVLIALGTGEIALARGNGRGDRGDRDGHGRGERAERGAPQAGHGNNGRGPERREHEGRGGDRRDGPPGRGNGERHGDERGAGPNHAYHRGDRLPIAYRHRQYVVDDWRGHHLSAPPRGYQWIQNGADYLLVGIATGMILQLFLGRRPAPGLPECDCVRAHRHPPAPRRTCSHETDPEPHLPAGTGT